MILPEVTIASTKSDGKRTALAEGRQKFLAKRAQAQRLILQTTNGEI